VPPLEQEEGHQQQCHDDDADSSAHEPRKAVPHLNVTLQFLVHRHDGAPSDEDDWGKSYTARLWVGKSADGERPPWPLSPAD